MNAEEILARPSRILNREQREQYFRHGYVGIPGLIGDDWLAPLRELTRAFVDASREIEASNATFDLEPTHTRESPRLRRLNSPVDRDELYWKFASEGPFVDIAEDLLGPDLKFHHAKLNFKWSSGGEEVKWHQDISFWPHTNYDVLTIGVYLEDVDASMAPMGIVPGSHEGPLFDQYDHDDRWAGHLREKDLPNVDVENAAYITGPAGTVTVHHCRAIHGSAPNRSERVRPLLLNAYAAADALPVTNLSAACHGETIVRGVAARWARFDPRPCLLPPDWSKQGGHRSIFAHQQKERLASPIREARD